MKELLIASVAVIALSVAPALAADMPVKAPPAPAVFNWTGIYVGGQAGYGYGHSAHFDPAVPGTTTGNFNIDGAIGGGTVGYNWQSQHWVIGLEADGSWSDIKGHTPSTVNFGCAVGFCDTNVDWFGTARGRIGYAADRWLAYATGGFAFGRVKAAIPNAGLSGTKTQDGWTVGGGLEYGIDRNWSAKIEYLHVDLGHFIYAPAFPFDAKAEFNVVRAGINYRFGTQ